MTTLPPAVSRLEAILDDADFWERARRIMIEAATPLFRMAYLMGARLGANEEPTQVEPGERAVLSALALAIRAAARPESPEVLLAHALKQTGPFSPLPADGRPLLPFDADAIVLASDEFIANYTNEWWGRLDTTTRNGLRRAIRRSAAEGRGVEKTIADIEPLFGRQRAELIAVSETTDLMGQGAQETYRRAGFRGWIWRTTNDPWVDPDCNDRARASDPARGGSPFPMSRRFEKAHPRCRCWPVPADDPTAAAPEEFEPRQPADSLPTDPAALTGPTPLPRRAPRDTVEMHTDADGNWTPDRRRMHDEIVSDLQIGTMPVPAGEQPTAYIMGGGPASGKSTVIERGNVRIPSNVVHIDSDAIKARLPEYQRMVAAGDPTAAAFAHEESSYLAKRALVDASTSRRNVLLDGTGDSSIESLTKKVEQARAGGQRVVANYVSLDTELAVLNSEARAAATGRRVPEEFIRDTHASVSRVLPQAVDRNLFDELYLFDTNINGQPRLVLSQVSGRTVIHDARLWDDFIAKGLEPGQRHRRFSWEASARRRGRDEARRMAPPRTEADEVREAMERIRENDEETAVAWLRDGSMLDKSEGHRSQVSFTPREIEQIRGSRRLLHNHPRSSSFSPDDVFLAHQNEIEEVIVTSRNADYTLRFTARGRSMTFREFEREFQIAKGERNRDFDNWIRSGQMTQEEANVAQWNAVWVRMRARGLVEYDVIAHDDLWRATYDRWH